MYKIKINGKQVHQITNTQPRSMEKVMVLTGDPWYPSVYGSIRNLIISEQFTKEKKIRWNQPLRREVSVGKEYLVSFEMKVTKHGISNEWRNEIHIVSNDWRNVIHFSSGGDGSRYPAVWLYRDNKLHISSTVSGNTNHVYNHNKPLKEGDWNQITIMQVRENDKVLNKINLLQKS